MRLDSVFKQYGSGSGRVTALDGVTLTLPTGSFTAVMGPSGSGKSTLLNCAAGLATPTSGRVAVGSHDITTLSPDELTRFRREHVGFVFQAYNLVPHLSVADNVALPVMLSGRPTDPAWQAELLDAVGLGGFEQRRPGELSGGQAQRVAIARALVTRPTVVFADEPTGALDSRTGAQVLETLRVTARQLGRTVVLVTHDPQVAAAADRVVFLSDGRIVDDLAAATHEQIAARTMTLSG
ncbi:MAG: ABC transporter ATP-binding protein [Terracoccus sp.]